MVPSKSIYMRYRNCSALLLYGFVTLIILGPLLVPGYILTLDMPWVPHPPIPPISNNTFFLQAALAGLSSIIPGWLVQKIILGGIIWLSGYGAHRLNLAFQRYTLSQHKPLLIAAYFSGLWYMINPFTYGRFMDGQWLVLAGYALLPWFTLAAAQFFAKPTMRRLSILLLWVLTITWSSLHSIAIAALLGSVLFAYALYRNRHQRNKLHLLLRWTGGFMVLAIVCNILWLVPYICGTSAPAATASGFDQRHDLSFRTVGHDWLPPAINVLTLHGYWGETQHRFLLDQNIVPLWPLFTICLLVVVAFGFLTLWRKNRALALNAGALLALTWLFALGTSTAFSAPMNQFMQDTVPFFAGYREPHKFTALLALAYSALGGLGAAVLLTNITKRFQSFRLTASFMLLALPLIATPLLLWGGFGQLRAVQYPAGWYQVKAYLENQPSQVKTLVLPWHLYTGLDFAGRTVASPAKRFLGGDVLQSRDLEIGLMPPDYLDKEEVIIQQYVIKPSDPSQIAAKLRQIGVDYIFLAKTADWEAYRHLRSAPGLTKAQETQSTILYKVLP